METVPTSLHSISSFVLYPLSSIQRNDFVFNPLSQYEKGIFDICWYGACIYVYASRSKVQSCACRF